MVWIVVAHVGGNSISLLCIPWRQHRDVDFA